MASSWWSPGSVLSGHSSWCSHYSYDSDVQPIHIDFLSLVSVDGLPERRYDFLPRRRLNGGVQPPRDRPVRKSVPPPESRSERMMYPFTITAGMGKTYTLCTG